MGMREIKFRGKVADEPDEWVIGYLIDEETIFQKVGHENSKCCECDSFRVDRETIGQYIGLADKNGKEICEKDLCLFDERVGIVVFQDCQFVIIVEDEVYPLAEIYSCELEIVGNIYDNPELLGENDDEDNYTL